jgi:hypothetical protein
MRKLFIFISAVIFAASMVSCIQEATVVKPGKGNVAFSIQTPGVATKVIGDGTNVDILYYEIYKAPAVDGESEHKNSVIDGKPLIDGTVAVTTSGEGMEAVTSATLNFNLLEDQDYVALFWAHVDGKSYYDVEDLRSVTVNYTDEEGKAHKANDESRAAFCQVCKFSTRNIDEVENNDEREYKVYEGPISVKLVRPFAQLNLGTEFESLDKDYLITMEQSKVVLTSVHSKYDVFSMDTFGDRAVVTFDFGDVPSQDLTTVNGTYAYAGMNYFLAPVSGSTLDLDYYIMTDVGTVNRSVSQVPVMANHRTNILGNLLTTSAELLIVIEKGFNEPDENIIPNN